MAYIKYKEITKYFNFIMVLDKDKLPSYIFEYIFILNLRLCSLYLASTS